MQTRIIVVGECIHNIYSNPIFLDGQLTWRDYIMEVLPCSEDSEALHPAPIWRLKSVGGAPEMLADCGVAGDSRESEATLGRAHY